ncbi:MAG: DedA family protein [Candidatus Colwellbacteria bacterium]|nr:DedA family protein [Candidatus Colwellbacteria bacterium]
MTSFLEYISVLALNIIGSFGYVGIFFLTLLNASAIPIPSEIVLPFSGFLTSTGQLSFLGVIIASILGGFCGSLIGFFIGRKIGVSVLDILSKVSLHNKNDFLKMEKWFSRFGAAIVPIGLCMPVVRSLISVTAGIFGIRFRSFLPAAALGTIIWSGALISLGRFTGDNWASIGVWFKKFDVIIILIIAAFIAVWLFRHIRANGSESKQKKENE